MALETLSSAHLAMLDNFKGKSMELGFSLGPIDRSNRVHVFRYDDSFEIFVTTRNVTWNGVIDRKRGNDHHRLTFF